MDAIVDVSEDNLPLDPRRRGELFQDCRPSLDRLARRLIGNSDDAADLVQEVGLRIIKHPTGPKDEACFRAWCFGMLRNTAADYRRSANRRGQTELVGLEIAKYEAVAHDPARGAELRDQLEDRLGQLDNQSFEILLRRYLLEETAAEIARSLNQSPTAVRMKLCRLRSKLHHLLLLLCCAIGERALTEPQMPFL